MSATEGAEKAHCLCNCNVGLIHLTLKVRLVYHFTSCDKISILSHCDSAQTCYTTDAGNEACHMSFDIRRA